MLDDDDRVALVPESAEGFEQAVVVAGMEADRGLVENIEHADQPAADLAGQADARISPPESVGARAVEREVFKAHVGQEPQASADLLDRFGRDRLVGRVEFQLGEKPLRLGDWQRANLGQRPLAAFKIGRRRRQSDGPSLAVQPLALAEPARDDIHVFFQGARAGRCSKTCTGRAAWG